LSPGSVVYSLVFGDDGALYAMDRNGARVLKFQLNEE